MAHAADTTGVIRTARLEKHVAERSKEETNVMRQQRLVKEDKETRAKAQPKKSGEEGSGRRGLALYPTPSPFCGAAFGSGAAGKYPVVRRGFRKVEMLYAVLGAMATPTNDLFAL